MPYTHVDCFSGCLLYTSLNGIVQGRHPGIALRDGKLRREIIAEHSGKEMCIRDSH